VKPPRRILVIKFRHIGDVLLTAPLISTLKRGLPGARVCAVVKPGTEAMLEGHPDLDRLYVLPARRESESRGSFLRRYMGFLRELRRERFDLAINSTEGDRGILLAWMVGAHERWGLIRLGRERTWQARLLTWFMPPFEGIRHTVIRNLALAGPLGIPECREVKLAVTEGDRARVHDLLATAGVGTDAILVHCHPASRWLFKCWPAARVAEVIDWLHGRGCRVVLTCAPESRERELVDAISAACTSRPVDLGGQLTLKQTAALSSVSRLFFGVDSAPMHMAAAVGTPTLGIFGPSGTFDWGPWPNDWSGADTPYPGRNGIKHAGPHTVVQDSRSCVPCGKDGCEGSKRSDCLEDMAASVVIRELERMLAD